MKPPTYAQLCRRAGLPEPRGLARYDTKRQQPNRKIRAFNKRMAAATKRAP